MVERVKAIIRRLRRSRLRVELGSETGIEEELERPTWKLEEKKTGKSLQVFGVKLTLRW